MVLSCQQVKSELDFRVSTLPTHLGALGRTIMYHITIIKPHCLGGLMFRTVTEPISTFCQNHDYFWWSTESKPHWSLTEACLSLSLSKENIRVMGIPTIYNINHILTIYIYTPQPIFPTDFGNWLLQDTKRILRKWSIIIFPMTI